MNKAMDKEAAARDGGGFREIDLKELAQKIWSGRRLIARMCCMAALVGLVVAFSIPRRYTTEIKLAPEKASGASSASGGMGALAAMAGINLTAAGSPDALSEDIYPDIINSTPFLTGLFNIRVKSLDNEVDTTLYGYMREEWRLPWWTAALKGVVSIPRKVKELISGDDEDAGKPLDPFRLTRKQKAIADRLSDNIKFSVNKKTGIMELAVTMQDPLISACMADTVCLLLQDYITVYRTDKARMDMEFSQQLFAEAKADYTRAQQAYAAFADSNQNIFLQRYKAEQERLQNEMSLAYQTYSQLAQQLQVARAKVQEITPVYTVVQPAMIPIRPAAPRKALILAFFVFLGGIAGIGRVLYVSDRPASILSGGREE